LTAWWPPGLILLAIATWGVVHSLLASKAVKRLARRWFGDLVDRGYRLVYNLISVITFLPLLALPLILPDRNLYKIPFPWLLLTTAVQLLAALSLVVGLLQTGVMSFLGLSQWVQGSGDGRSELIVHGLYRWVRHPLYTAGLVFIWLIPVMTVNLLVFNLGLSAYLVIGAYFEERKLMGDFGQAYLSYRAQTPMLVPWLRFKGKPPEA
jgi:protein-S-isoprenylcysteine O-methyltransferase Ste14